MADLRAPVKKEIRSYRRTSRGHRSRTARQIVMDAMLLALEKGPATAREIEQRIGFTYCGACNSPLSPLARVLERQGKIARIGMTQRLRKGRYTRGILWALVIKEPS